MLPSVRRVLELPEVQKGLPSVCAGVSALDTPVRWVHVSELPDISYLLEGGELILTTGIALPPDASGLVRYIDELAATGPAGLIIELGRRFDALPPALVDAADRHNLPLVALAQEVRFVEVTEAVHSIIVDAQLAVLRASKEAHQTFTELTIEGATPSRIVTQASAHARQPVIFEDMAHRVLSFDGLGGLISELLEDWERRSRLIRTHSRTAHVADSHGTPWLVTTVGARGDRWGRLLMQVEYPTEQQTIVLEQAATALALNRLVERDRETLERQSHRTLLNDLKNGSFSSVAEVQLRAQSLGVPLRDRTMVGVAVRAEYAEELSNRSLEARVRDTGELLANAARSAGAPALVGPVDSGDIASVFSTTRGSTSEEHIAAFAREAHRAAALSPDIAEITIGVGSAVSEARELRRSLSEAEQVLDAARGLEDGKLYYEVPDIRIRGLVFLLRDDPRLQTFVERELGPLLELEERSRASLLAVLEAYLKHGGNKSVAADALGMSRPTLYNHLSRLERLLQVDLATPESLLSLHVALLARSARQATDAP